MAGVCKLVAVLSGGQWLVRGSWLLFCQETSGRPMAGMCKLVAVLSGGQWLVCVSRLLFCQEASGWCVLGSAPLPSITENFLQHSTAY